MNISVDIVIFILVGFAAQAIDGSLGMAYGVSANSFLLSTGISPVVASASVHASEVVTTAISGLSHWHFENTDKTLIKKLIIPGVIGGIVGAYALSNIDGKAIKPYVSLYLIIMGIRIFILAFKKKPHSEKQLRNRFLFPLGVVGGVFDAMGGGGWGPIVTTTLMGRGKEPRKIIGSVNLTEFFVTAAESATFIATIGLTNWQVIIGLIVGGALAAPFGAFVTKKVPHRVMMFCVGGVITILSIRTIFISLY
ncbi:MAG: sulfite exporter TauE/SafE family protein [Chloroflexota bacterium]|nr:sulfite exporter TauE/SafE family protein [Chloroflexota bacterium]